ncbi:MAG TPA: hypothetical protein VEB20_01010, partial [Azospirillaceae bacterium]|nr:hypothetical protein [Azospirillaceae bacterium]
TAVFNGLATAIQYVNDLLTETRDEAVKAAEARLEQVERRLSAIKLDASGRPGVQPGLPFDAAARDRILADLRAERDRLREEIGKLTREGLEAETESLLSGLRQRALAAAGAVNEAIREFEQDRAKERRKADAEAERDAAEAARRRADFEIDENARAIDEMVRQAKAGQDRITAETLRALKARAEAAAKSVEDDARELERINREKEQRLEREADRFADVVAQALVDGSFDAGDILKSAIATAMSEALRDFYKDFKAQLEEVAPGLGRILGEAFAAYGIGQGLAKLLGRSDAQARNAGIGGAVGRTAGQFLPGGPALWQTIGSLLGGLLGPGQSVGPNANAGVLLADGRLGPGLAGTPYRPRADNGGDLQGIARTARSVSDTVNDILERFGGSLTSLNDQLRIGTDKDGFLVGTGAQFGSRNAEAAGAIRVATAEEAVAVAVRQLLTGRFGGTEGIPQLVRDVLDRTVNSPIQDVMAELERAEGFRDLLKPFEEIGPYAAQAREDAKSFAAARRFAAEYQQSLEEVAQAEQARAARLRGLYEDDQRRAINAATGRGYLNDAADLIRIRDTGRAEGIAVGSGTALADQRFAAEVAAFVRGAALTTEALADLDRQFGSLPGVLDVAGVSIEGLTQALEQAGRSAAEIASERAGLEQRLLQLQGDTAELRRREMEALDPSNRAIQQQIWLLEDQAAAAAEANRVASEGQGLQRRLWQLEGDTASLRAAELAELAPGNRALLERIHRLEDEAEATQRAAAVASEREGLQRQLWQLEGNTAAIRQAELATLDPSNRALLERIHRLQDEQKTAEDAARAAEALAAAQRDLVSAGGAVRAYLDRQRSGGIEQYLPPSVQLSNAAAAFQRQIALAGANDRDALASITGYADSYIQALLRVQGSGTDSQTIIRDILEDLESLPATKSFDAQQVELLGQIRDATKGAWEVLKLADLDGNSRVTWPEFDAWAGANTAAFNDLKRLTGDGNLDARTFFNKHDINGDGVLSRDELTSGAVDDLAGTGANASLGAIGQLLYAGNVDRLNIWHHGLAPQLTAVNENLGTIGRFISNFHAWMTQVWAVEAPMIDRIRHNTAETARMLGGAPAYAGGTDFHPGGWAIVGERGRELVNLPRGASVLPSADTDRLLRGQGGSAATNGNGEVLRELRRQNALLDEQNRLLRRVATAAEGTADGTEETAAALKALGVSREPVGQVRVARRA